MSTTTSRTPRGPYKQTPHPMEPQIRELLAQGLNNNQIVEKLNAPPRVVARIRKETGTAPAPRSTWRRTPHPKTREINELLGDGHNDAEIRRRTGADVRTIAGLRTAGGYGKPTIGPKPRAHPREAEIRELLPLHSSEAIARLLGVDRAAVRRIRAEAGIPYVPAEQTRTIEEKWKLFARPVGGGHVEWTGERATGGTPLLTYKDRRWGAAAVAFQIRTGREPEGYAIAECAVRHCVAPEHVEDEPGRAQVREQLRYLIGGRERKARCVHGHDQAVHGGYETDGVAYCRECKRLTKHAGHGAVAL